MEDITGKDVFQWCQQKGKNPQRCFGIGGDFSGFFNSDVILQIKMLYGVYQPKIVDQWREETGNICAMLVETEGDLDANLIPLMVMVDKDTGRRWNILWPELPLVEDADTSPKPRAGRINSNGGKGGDTPSGNEDHLGGQFESIMDRVVTQLERWHYEGSYRRLRIFSGIQPVPQGEETFESWKEAAIQQTEEWQCPDHIKKQRVVESLRGPAMGVIQAARRSDPNATIETYFEALDYAYGTLEDVGDLVSRMHHTFQESGEKLSTFLYRLDRLLYKIVDKGGIKRIEVDDNRMKQLLRGALTTDPVAQKLRCSGARMTPPTFNDLMKEVKQEETLIEMRERTIKKVKVVVPTVEPNLFEEKILKLMEEQNKRIEQFIASQSAGVAPRGNSRSREMGRGDRNINRGCFRCGRYGHRAIECNQNRSLTNNTRDEIDRGSTDQGNGRGRSVVVPSLAP
ncbi:paraneoplastic antigen Ma1 homolog [Pseudophryne corroboree]|uniref:paraneoplastic antigen Ma1 homolog n=1 Tax=Pseudophryne corroboree TaxID=495146 RepID=UPI0030819895